MAVSPLGVLTGMILIFLAPGFFLLQALFPGRRYFGPFHAAALVAFSMALSVAITVVVGTILGFLPGGPDGRGWSDCAPDDFSARCREAAGEARGWFQGSQTGAPVLELTLGSISLLLFAIAWWRGAFPLLGREREYDSHAERGEPEEMTMLRDLRLEEERLRKEAARVRKRATQSRDPGVRGALGDAAKELERERAAVAKRAKDLEHRAGERRYGAGAVSKKDAWRLRSR